MPRQSPLTLDVPEDGGDVRLDRWLRRQFPGLTQGRIEKLLRKGAVRVNGSRAKKSSDRLAGGDRVQVPHDIGEVSADTASGDGTEPRVPRAPRAPRPPTPEEERALEASVLHRDASVLVLDKAAGLAVQGGTGTTRHLDALLDLFTRDGSERPRLVHRLDKDTSGVLVLARTLRAAQFLTRAFRNRDTQKIYWALVVGVPELEQGTINAPLAKEAAARGERMTISDDGRAAVTDYRMVDHAGKAAAWLEMRPRTGRTHQLRVHATALGTPILGDGKYAGVGAFLSGDGFARQLHLHARALSIPHPDGGRLEVTAPVPAHFRASMAALGFHLSDAPDPFSGWLDTDL
ncbi:RluA family pseudouridine synthase [Phaeovibrio sulfidiphilus]|uniref:Pseudouridine synthase n=2 Tax=Phaeovibrio sulfidiphilus TaxID=1220600 RepID=A0A8J7CF91_9PROT|nr:RluA family pseudouridine synthase [Phaeovibrio sulfidiphilus]